MDESWQRHTLGCRTHQRVTERERAPPRPDTGKYRGPIENPLPLLVELIFKADNGVSGS